MLCEVRPYSTYTKTFDCIQNGIFKQIDGKVENNGSKR